MSGSVVQQHDKPEL